MKTLISTLIILCGFAAVADDVTCVREGKITHEEFRDNKLYIEAYGDLFVADIGICPFIRQAYRRQYITWKYRQICPRDFIMLFDSHGRFLDRCLISSLQKVR